jgi:hypothetical protein
MTTDYRALCAELVEKLDALNCSYNIPSQSALVERVRALLDQPEPMPPTDEELLRLAAHIFGYTFKDGGIGGGESEFLAFARAVWRLARYGTPANQPVPVSERLPGPEDLNGEGWCWWFDGLNWMLDEPENWYTHWLPYHALPTPEATNA